MKKLGPHAIALIVLGLVMIVLGVTSELLAPALTGIGFLVIVHFHTIKHKK